MSARKSFSYVRRCYRTFAQIVALITIVFLSAMSQAALADTAPTRHLLSHATLSWAATATADFPVSCQSDDSDEEEEEEEEEEEPECD